MPPIQRKAVPTKNVAPTKVVEDEEDDEEIEEDEIEDDTVEVEDAEEAGDDETEDEADAEEETEEDEADEEEFVGLPDYVEPIGAPNEGFNYFDTVHTDLKAAGYVKNQGETKALIKYFNQMMFANAFENGKHDIDGLGSIYSDIKPAKEMTATSTFGGKTVGEKYTVDAKHFFGFKMSGKAKTKLAEISELDGWSPEEVLALIAEGQEEDAE